MKKFKKIISALLLITTFALVIILVFTRIQGKTPQIFGYQILRISSGSMSPELEVGDIILSKRVKDVTSLEVGDVITYNGEFGSYAGKSITHKVITEPYEVNGTIYLQTKGVANNYIDPEISESQVVGKMICVIPFLGAVYGFFMTKWGLAVVLVCLGLLFINEIISLIGISKSSQIESSDSKESSEENVNLD